LGFLLVGLLLQSPQLYWQNTGKASEQGLQSKNKRSKHAFFADLKPFLIVLSLLRAFTAQFLISPIICYFCTSFLNTKQNEKLRDGIHFKSRFV
jgi:hypothetical protein